MGKHENVIKELEALKDSMCKNQCYSCSHEFIELGDNFGTEIVEDAIELLKEQKEILDLQHSSMRGSADMIELLFRKFDEIVLCKDCKYRGNKLCPFYQKYQGEKI